MTRITASQLREQMASAVNKVSYGGERLVLQRNGKDIAAIISIEDLNRLLDLEDRSDLAEMEKALREPGANIPWERVKKGLRK